MKLIALAATFCALTTPLTAQWLTQPTPNIPRTADGKPSLFAHLPRTADGKPDLTGLWHKASDLGDDVARGLKPEEIQSWARALVEERREDFGKGHMRVQCLPWGPNAVTYGVEPQRFVKIIQTPSLVVLLHGDLTFRQIHMDGRVLEADPNPSWMGYSVGRWDGDTLVVESNGYNDRTWLDGGGHPHTESLRTTERYRRRDFGHLEVEMTFHDPAVYARPWTVSFTASLAADTELLEWVCNENPNRLEHWVGRASDALKTAVSVDPAVLATYVGTYLEQPPTFLNRSPGRVIQISLRDGRLFGNLNGGGDVALVPQSDTVFLGLSVPIEFVREGAVATGLRAKQAVGEFAFTRTKQP